METEEKPQLDLSSLSSLGFTPDWAKKDAGVTAPKGGRAEKGRPDGGRLPKGGRGKPGFGGGRSPNGHASRPAPRPFVKPLAVDVKILPETKALGTIIRKLQQDAHAYKLKDLAFFFLDNPSSVLLKISPKADAPDGQFHQCKACGFASTSEADVAAHALAAHLADYYTAEEVACEPPKGNFNCVAKCGLSGVLLGPPNIHEFNATVREMIRTRFPDMTEEAYRARIEMVRDPEVIEQWRQGATKKTLFTPKSTPEEPAPDGSVRSPNGQQLTREQAEGEFKRLFLPALLSTPKHLMITADLAQKSPCRPLQWAVKDALEAERRSPHNMCFALRGAFHHRKMHFFRANDARGPEFVTGSEPKVFDTAHAIPELAKIASFIAEHPCSTKAEIAPDAESEKNLAWLVSTGHAIAFTNGVYSAVEKFPKYGPQWRKKTTPVATPEEKPTPVVASVLRTDNKEESVPNKEESISEEKKEDPQNEAPPQLAQ